MHGLALQQYPQSAPLPSSATHQNPSPLWFRVPDKAKQLLGIAAHSILPVSELVVMAPKDLDLLKNQVPR